MDFFRFCCANSRNEAELNDSSFNHAMDPNSSINIEKRLQLAKNVLIEYMQFEHSMGMKNLDIILIIEMVLKQSNSDNEVPKKELQQIYNKSKDVNLKQLKKVLMQQFFFTDTSRINYDFSKVQLFNILYSGGNEAYKANFFFKLVQSSSTGCINNGSTKLLKALEYMTIITCIIMSDALIKEIEVFSDEDDELQFEELHKLYTTNHLIVKEFAQYLNETLLFPSNRDSEENKSSSKSRRSKSRSSKQKTQQKYLMLKDFQQLMSRENLDFTLVRPNEIRQRFTEFVMRNQSIALIEQNQSMAQSEGFFQQDSILKSKREFNKKDKRRDQEDYDLRASNQSSQFGKVKQNRTENQMLSSLNSASGIGGTGHTSMKVKKERPGSSKQSHKSLQERQMEMKQEKINSSMQQQKIKGQKSLLEIDSGIDDSGFLSQAQKITKRHSIIQSILEESDSNEEKEDEDKKHEDDDDIDKDTYQINNPQMARNQIISRTPRAEKKDRSLVNYGYEDKSAGAMKQTGEDVGDGSFIDPETMFQGNLLPSSYYAKGRNSNILSQRHSNIERIRKTARKSMISNISGISNMNSPYKNLKDFLDDMFSDQFIKFTNQIKKLNSQNQVGEDIVLLDKFDQNEQFLMTGDPNEPLVFPKDFQKRYPQQLREIFEYFQKVMKKSDLLAFMQGTLFSEKILNMYFKILEKMNLVQLSMDNYQRQQQIQETPDGLRNSVSSNILLGTNTMKIQYLSTSFVRKLRLQNVLESTNNAFTPDEQDSKNIDEALMQYFNHDLVLVPFIFHEIDKPNPDNHQHLYGKNPETGENEAICGCDKNKRAVLVSVKVLDNQVDLFDKEFRDHDNHDISNCVLHVMDIASRLQEIELNEELIDAECENIQGVDDDEDMLVTICYIAECFTFGREPDIENIDLDYQRKHIVDVFLQLLNFK